MRKENKPMAELMDVYDENRHLTGLRLERTAFLREGQFLLYVLAILSLIHI